MRTTLALFMILATLGTFACDCTKGGFIPGQKYTLQLKNGMKIMAVANDHGGIYLDDCNSLADTSPA